MSILVELKKLATSSYNYCGTKSLSIRCVLRLVDSLLFFKLNFVYQLFIYLLILVSAVKVNADFNNIQDNFEYQEEQLTIELPWSDCTEIHKLLEEKLSFSEQQIKKENKIHEKYKQFYLKHNNLTNFSMQFLEKKSETNGVETLISGFLKFCEDNFQTSKSKSNSLNYYIKKQQDQWFNDIRNENYKIYYRKKYEDNIFRNN